ncbi:hypothetical protein CRENBAI_007751 [Crenichthys baileyi]|uniref:Uncharacterized protein n=1 Tax=Crenichthys baileyi TaxID=28760 RepID=A0AAV9RLU0_9TELE
MTVGHSQMDQAREMLIGFRAGEVLFQRYLRHLASRSLPRQRLEEENPILDWLGVWGGFFPQNPLTPEMVEGEHQRAVVEIGPFSRLIPGRPNSRSVDEPPSHPVPVCEGFGDGLPSLPVPVPGELENELPPLPVPVLEKLEDELPSLPPLPHFLNLLCLSGSAPDLQGSAADLHGLAEVSSGFYTACSEGPLHVSAGLLTSVARGGFWSRCCPSGLWVSPG